MINTKRLVEMVKKWQKLAAVRRRRIALPRSKSSIDGRWSSRKIVEKGHFVVYTIDGARFVVPLVYLESEIFKELFKISEDEFGLPVDGPITLPCHSVLMDYIVWLFQRRMSEDVEKALLISIATGRCSTSSLILQGQTNQQILVHGF